MKRLALLSLLAVLSAMTAAPGAQAADPRLIAQHDKWGSYVIGDRHDKVCYMASHPDTQEGDLKGKNRGDVYALVTHRPGDGTRNVFSYVAGYSYKDGSDATASIDGKTFTLFTRDDSAWARTTDDDNAIAAALRKGSKLTVTGVSARGTKTTDTLSLKGTGAAYADISRECGVQQ